MSETQVGFLCKAAASLQRAENNDTLTFLRSYYLMRCKEVTKGYGLPEKQFSSKVRCSRCCLEWQKGTEIKIKSVKLSKKQRQRIKSQKVRKDNRVNSRKELLHSNEIIQLCTFCKQSTVTFVPKPEKVTKIITKPANNESLNINKLLSNADTKITVNLKKTKTTKTNETKTSKVPDPKKNEVNVYSITKDVFSLCNNKNNLPSAQKEEKKIIKNNKKKKDKFAGLCQKAVIASAKLKEAKDKQNKLNLFLKPSS
ncbi:uncharacterized protein LOC126377195 [Pectinophora gossypiella]|uniref:uncharacterized protein LOC126377195 n=1 Tax=Pectinophora gossypiella TaxID=13191 RepID=UPI00214E7623|nr:uncharacterized protein LOC126377195 [Pectinophora gossypiella]